MNIRQKGKRLNVRNVDARQILEELGIPYTESGNNVSSGWLGVRCVFCDDQSNHMGIHIDSKAATCWKCGPHGSILNYLSELYQSFDKAHKLLQKYVTRELKEHVVFEGPRAESVELPKEAERGLSKYQAAYLKKRGFDPDKLVQMYNLHYCPPYGEWANRIIVPIIYNYTLVTFTSIDISEETEFRYKHLAEEKSIRTIKECLYGEEFTDYHSVIVVEGIFDAWRFLGGAIPMWGVKVTPFQKKLLSKYKIIKCVGDGDKDGWRFNQELATDLAPFSETIIFDLPSGVDPDKLTKEEIEYIKKR